MIKLLVFLMAFLITKPSFASKSCTTFKYSDEVSTSSQCFMGILSSIISGKPFHTGYLNKGSICSGERIKVKNSKSYIAQEEKLTGKTCKVVKKLRPLKTDILVKREKQCEIVLNFLMQRLNDSKINFITVDNFSNFCNPKDIEVTGLCCE